MNSQQMLQLVWILVIFGGMYFLFVRPQMKRQKEQQKLIESLQIGDQIVTIGGILGTIKALDAEQLSLEIATGVVIDVVRSAVGKKLDK